MISLEQTICSRLSANNHFKCSYEHAMFDTVNENCDLTMASISVNQVENS